MLNKLTDKQKEKLGNLCWQINSIFEDEVNFDEDYICEWHDSKLYKGIYDVMYDLGVWC